MERIPLLRYICRKGEKMTQKEKEVKEKQSRVFVDEDIQQAHLDVDEDIRQAHLDALLGPVKYRAWEVTSEQQDNILFGLSGFLYFVQEYPGFVAVPGMTQVYDDLELLKTFVLDLPQHFVPYGDILVRDIDYFLNPCATLCDVMDDMDEEKASKLVKRLDHLLKIMSHWMDLFRIIYGKPPKASPVCCSLDYQVAVDPLVNYYLKRCPLMPEHLEIILLLRAILQDPPQDFTEDDTIMKMFEFTAKDIGFVISSIDLNNMDQEVDDVLRERLDHALLGAPRNIQRLLENKVADIKEKRPKLSRNFYPKTAQLDFVDLLVDNLDELLLRANTDSSIRVLEFDIVQLQWELQQVSCQLVDIPEPREEEEDMKDIITSTANLAYEAEYVIDSFLVGDIPICYSMLWLRDLLPELKHQRGLIKLQSGDAESIASIILSMGTRKLGIVAINSNDTEIGDKLNQILNQMRHVFDVCTRSLVLSFKEREKEVFRGLLHNSSFRGINFPRNAPLFGLPISDEIGYTSSMTKAELEDSVCKLLKHRSYFIILEEVHDVCVLNDIKRVLPNDEYTRQAVVFTTSSPELLSQYRYDSDQMSEHHPSTSKIERPTTENNVVGFMEEMECMLERLTRGPTKLQIISIVGMAGQGKTTLAQKLFNDPLVSEYFDTRAWCCVSQVYERRQLLLELLGQVVQLSSKDHQKDETELFGMLYKHLKGRRFLIFLDDMWEIDAWNDLRRCFSDDKNGSRIMFTTRIQGLASKAKDGSIVQSIGPLSDDESWKLLEKKLFQKESCPIELLDFGREIAKNCKGLPLSIVLIAGLLAKMEKSESQWKQIVETSSSLILRDAEAQGKVVIDLSYKHLPDHLKSCFLYFGAFLEDKEVPVSKLMRLWIAEGFVKRSDLSSLEDVAEDYFIDLIGRSLVTICQEKSNGGVKSCRVHDLLREFCLTKAKEENFMQKIDEYDQNTCPSNSSSFIEGKCHLRRLYIYPGKNNFTALKPFGPFVRSLLFFSTSDTYQSYSYDISFIFHNFKFLKILNLEDINVGESFKKIGDLILLRYLACQSSVDLIPSSIANIWNLQTFVFKAFGVEVVKVPDSIWDMTKLRHLHVNDGASFNLEPHRLENSFVLDNLQTFSTPSLAYGDDMEKLMRKLPGIRKLKCIFMDSWSDTKNCNQFPELEFLSQLVSLNIIYNGRSKYPCQFNFPSNLKKLTLSNFRMPWNEISQLVELCELEVLKLLDNAFEGETWEMEDEVFPKLKFLKLDSLNVKKWSATDDHFPCLEHLLLHKCEQLEEIPAGIGEIQTLQMIEVMWCNRSTAVSAINIQEEQLEYGEGLKIHVHPKV